MVGHAGGVHFEGGRCTVSKTDVFETLVGVSLGSELRSASRGQLWLSALEQAIAAARRSPAMPPQKCCDCEKCCNCEKIFD
jgi:hypothetical protein